MTSSEGQLAYGESNLSPDNPERRLQIANITYVVFFVIIAVLSFILYNTRPLGFGKIINTQHTTDSEKHKLGISLVARTSASSGLFYLLHSLACLCNRNLEDSLQFKIHVSFLPLHFLLFLGLYALFLFAIPDAFFDVYIYFTFVASGFYLILQLIFLIDFFYRLNDRFSDKSRTLIIFTAILGFVTLLAFGIGFWQYHDRDLSVAILGVNIGLSLVTFGAAAFIEHASIFTASMITAYVAFLTYSGCMCVTGVGKTDIIISILMGIVMLLWVGWSAFRTTEQFGQVCNCCENEGEEERMFSLSFFHGLYALASVYLTAIATNWAREEANEWSVGDGLISMWANWISAWVSILLYGWTMVAPLLFPEREFQK